MALPPIDLGEGLSLHPVMPEDHEMLSAWIAADPHHRDKCGPEFFSEPLDCWLLLDEAGPVFFLKLTRAVRLDVQFSPRTTEVDRMRTRRGLHVGFPALARLLSAQGYKQVLFDADTETLARSMEKRMGFKRTPGELVRTLEEG